MGRKKKKVGEVCPICDCAYDSKHRRTRHHIFPKWWYSNGLTVVACSKCHQKEFHVKYVMSWKNPWTPSECLNYWVKFCKLKGKNAYVIYPELMDLQSLY
jgi:hypothetical protein